MGQQTKGWDLSKLNIMKAFVFCLNHANPQTNLPLFRALINVPSQTSFIISFRPMCLLQSKNDPGSPWLNKPASQERIPGLCERYISQRFAGNMTRLVVLIESHLDLTRNPDTIV